MAITPMKLFKTCCIILLAFLCAGCTLVLLIQEDSWFLARLHNELEMVMSHNFDCQFRARTVRCNILTGKLVLKDIVVTPSAGDAWRWDAREIELLIHYIPSYQQKKAVASLAVHEMKLSSAVTDGSLAIAPHLHKFIRPSATAVALEAQTVNFAQCSWHIRHPAATTTGTFHAYAQLQKKIMT